MSAPDKQNQSQSQSKKFGLNAQFWNDLYALETCEHGCEYMLDTAYRLQNLEKQGFVNPWSREQPTLDDLAAKINEAQLANCEG
jgi:hypothetical protein